MSVIRTFVLNVVALCAMLAMLLAPSNASAMINCLDPTHVQHTVGFDKTDDHGVYDVTVEDSHHQMSHCQSHACTAGVLYLPAQAPCTLLVKSLDKSWGASSLVTMATAEGLRRPPRV